MGSAARRSGVAEPFVTLGRLLPTTLSATSALVAAGSISLLGTLLAMPRILRKLRGAGIVGRDINKPGRPEVPEMGGIAVFLGFNTGVFVFLALFPLPTTHQLLVLVALITAAGAAMTGIIDDLVELRQRFKAFIPVVFAAPFAIYVPDYAVTFPVLGTLDFGLAYPLLLVPLGITCAANGFNMLEGYNGLGAGLGILSTVTLGVLATANGHSEALVLLVPLLGALVAFLWFNRYPAKAFPGDTMTLLVGAVLACAAIIGKVELWGALLFAPHVIEFLLKARGSFEAENFARRIISNPHDPPILMYEGRTESLTHFALRRGNMTEPKLTALFWAGHLVLCMIVLGLFLVAA